MLTTILITFAASLIVGLPFIYALCWSAKRGDESMEKFIDEYRRTHP